MSLYKMMALMERREQEDTEKRERSLERMELCEGGTHVWCCSYRPFHIAAALRDEKGLVKGVPVCKWRRGHKVERFYRKARSERPVCGARCRSGEPCKARVCVREDGTLAGRCRMHGGLSTAPKTKQGRAAIAESNRRRAVMLKG